MTAARDERGALLLALARESIARALGLRPEPADDSASWLAEPGATFVTLHQRGELRGCIGSVEARRPLRDDIRHNARAAALSDPRFPPVSREEYPDIDVEVSLLTPPQPLAARTEAEALAELRPGRDGVILEWADRSATFLPQVWEALPDAREFLHQLKRKAGLPPDFWAPDLRLLRYEVEKWGEEKGRLRP